MLFEENGSLGAGEVWFLAAVNGQTICLLSVWEFLSMDRAAAWAKWRCHERPVLFALDVIRAVCVYRKYADHVVTLFPSYYM